MIPQVIPENEECRRPVTQSTLFFMPRCQPKLIGNLLDANWDQQSLRQVSILGNPFEHVAAAAKGDDFTVPEPSRSRISAADCPNAVLEVALNCTGGHQSLSRAMGGMSLTFFPRPDLFCSTLTPEGTAECALYLCFNFCRRRHLNIYAHIYACRNEFYSHTSLPRHALYLSERRHRLH
jgi:hypothetical protein